MYYARPMGAGSGLNLGFAAVPVERVREIAKGHVWTGAQAKSLGLVDEIGGEDAAVAWLEGTKGIDKDLKVVDWSPERPYAGLGLADRAMAAVGRMVGIDLSAWNGEGRLDGLVSVWHPQSSNLQ